MAHWLCEHLDGINHPLVIDDLHDAAADPSIAAFVAKFAELRPTSSLTIALRRVGELPVPLWMATQRMERPIDEADLRFNDREVADIAQQFGLALDRNEIAALLARTHGSATAIVYAVTRQRRSPGAFSSAAAPSTFEDIAADIFARRSGHERALLFTTALYSSIDDELLAQNGWSNAPEIRSTMAEDAAFMWERDEAGILRFHDRFRDYLAQQFAAHDLEFRSTIANRAVLSLRLAGRYADALDVATRQRLLGVMVELLDERGFEILESGEIDVISDALDAFDPAERSVGAKVFALRGYLDSQRGYLDTAEAYFRLGLETAHDENSRAEVALYFARELAVRRREDACDVIAPFVDSTILSPAVLIDVRSSYAQGLAAASRLDEACARTDEVLAMLGDDVSPALRARVFARAAFVAIESGALDLARARALIAAPLAIAESLYDVAASTYSVLYNIAYGDDDAAASLAYLRRLRDLGLKSGTLRLDLYALLGMYELAAEAGDVGALAELERQLSTIDKQDAGVEIMEAMLPAKALQAAWSGDFEAAIQLVRPTAEQYATPERRALCWAQIAVYCAALADAQRAHDAVRLAQITLQQVDVQTSLSELTLLTLSLARLAGGNIHDACTWMNTADRRSVGTAPRLRALRAALAALIAESRASDRLGPGVCAALGELRAVSFGGMARLIEALPYRPDESGREAQTIGILLAKHELRTRLDAAAEVGDASGLCTWLDALPGSVVRELSIVAAFDRWAAGRTVLDRHSGAVIRKLRREVTAYQPPAPVFIRLFDDVDVSIGTLLGHLDAAAPWTAEHSRAVSAWCSRIARTLGLSEAQIEFVTRCGLIHDIGKMRTPPDILNAPRGLTVTEWPIMQDHAAEGGRIVAELAELRPFVPIVRGHHERLDGNGYPDGLRLDAIPLAARIVAVADSFNAMIGRRPYRQPIPPAEALIELERNSETQFDPEIVSAMIRVVDSRPV